MLNKARHWLCQWRGLAAWERSTLMSQAFRLAVVWLLLRLLGFKKMHRLVEAGNAKVPAHQFSDGLTSAAYAQRCAQLTEIAARHGLYQANCLHQSLALCWLLRRNGLQARLRIGVKPDTKPFQAHAWVELDGEILGRPIDEYQPFTMLKPSGDLKPIN